MLGLEDQLIFLCVHAAKHQWAQLGIVRDISALARFDLDWELVMHEARRLGIVRIVLISLVLADELMGWDIPEPFAGLNEIGAARKCVPATIHQITTMREIPPESSAYFRFMLQVRERMLDHARLLWRLATTPSVGEWQAMKMPDVLFPLYPIIRAARLARRFV
jgi:hypothetical protein